MSVTLLTGLGELNTNFILNDFDMYIQNTSATGGYVSTDWAKVGYTSPEKTVTPIREVYTREDKVPRVPTYQKTIRAGLELKFGLSNQNEDFEAMVSRGSKSTTSTATRIAHGTEEASTEYRAVRLVTTRDDGKYYAITVPKCEISMDGDKTYGGVDSEVITPLTLKAFYCSNLDATANLWYENYWATSVSPTADVPGGYA